MAAMEVVELVGTKLARNICRGIPYMREHEREREREHWCIVASVTLN